MSLTNRHTHQLENARLLMQQWTQDWNKFIYEALGAELDNEQKAIVDAVQNNKLVSVRSGTARGKDYVSACIALAFLYLTPKWKRGTTELIENTKVALTAPTERQVKNIMMPEIARLFNRAKRKGVHLTGELLSQHIRTNSEEWFLTGFKADEHNHEAWSGFHAANTMFVVTEATGITDDTFEAIEGNLQGNSRLLLVFNPNTTLGYAARSQSSPRWKKFRLSSLSAPNVVAKKIIHSGQVDYEWVQDKVEAWCTPIQQNEFSEAENDFMWEGHAYRPSDLFRRKVLGEFPKVDEDILVPQSWVELAQERWKQYNHTDSNNGIIGLDVAGMGRDASVFCTRYNNYVAGFDKINSGGRADHMAIAGKAYNQLSTHSGMSISIDTIGEGAGVYSRLVELSQETDSRVDEMQIQSCKYSAGAKDGMTELTDITGQYRFANMRAYLHWAVRDWLNPDNNTNAMLPPDGSLMEEITSVKWSFLSNGKVIIEPKDDIKARLGHSPDELDALCNTFFPDAIRATGMYQQSIQHTDEDLDDYETDIYD